MNVLRGELKIKESEVHNLSETLSVRGKNLVDISNDQNASSKSASSSVENFSHLVSRVIEVKDLFGKSYNLVEEKLKEGKNSVEIMKESAIQLADSSKKLVSIENYLAEINKKIQKANVIFEQTRLLSFNASIEAAHAGKYGKGFGVIASEVSSLAEDSDKTFKEIFQIVNTSKTEINLILNNTRHLIDNSKSNSFSALDSLEQMNEELKKMSLRFKDLEKVSRNIDSEFAKINSSIKMIDIKMPEELNIAKGIETISNQLNAISKEMVELVTKTEDAKK